MVLVGLFPQSGRSRRRDGLSCAAGSRQTGDERPGRKLFTSLLVAESEAGTVQAFDATIARTEAEVRERLRERHGPRLAQRADVIEGFDAGLPLVSALVSDAMADMLKQIARQPTSPLAEGLDVRIEQRFLA